ncbi:MAG: hypothetical protein HY744_29680 [Deltaproteobacteria bacterium]|nr:hypothetical protein [Deltaproteobacteria bacterium]
MSRLPHLGAAVVLLCFAVAAACGSGEPDVQQPSPVAGGASATGGNGGTGGETTSSGGDIGFDSGPGDDSGIDKDAACGSETVAATMAPKPVDIIFVIDNSGSMTPQILGVQNNINAKFADIIAKSGVDYRVIMLAQHGQADGEGQQFQSVCIEAPLSSVPPGSCENPPPTPGINPPRFFHYSVEIGSHDAWCQIINTYAIADKFFLAQTGWREWLRHGAFKVLVVLTDDGVGPCAAAGKNFLDGDQSAAGKFAAESFDPALLKLDPEQFGVEKKRNYRWHSIIGIAAHPSNPWGVWMPSDEVAEVRCSPDPEDDCSLKNPPPGCTPGPGTGYQWLSKMTGGLRFPLCDPSHFDVVFDEIAQGVIEGALVPCQLNYPQPAGGKKVVRASIKIEYAPGDGSAPIDIEQVPGPDKCGENKFYIDDMGTPQDEKDDLLMLCDETCAVVGADKKAKISIFYLCETLR